MAREIPAAYDQCTPPEKLEKVYAANAGKLSYAKCAELMRERGEVSEAEYNALRSNLPVDAREALKRELLAELRAELTKDVE